MKTKILLLLFMVSGYHTSAQKIIIKGKETDRQLFWKDFTGAPDNNSTFWAFTSWNLKYNYGTQMQGDSFVIKNYELTLQLNPETSWVKKGKESDYLLAHEQGHFDLGIICMREILKKQSETTVTRENYKTVLGDIFQEKLKKFKALGALYDKETEHSKNRQEQEKWNQYFLENLSK
ncbi:MAG: DUF922 domain-containing protein [Ginsengibacter sp.]